MGGSRVRKASIATANLNMDSITMAASFATSAKRSSVSGRRLSMAQADSAFKGELAPISMVDANGRITIVDPMALTAPPPKVFNTPPKKEEKVDIMTSVTDDLIDVFSSHNSEFMAVPQTVPRSSSFASRPSDANSRSSAIMSASISYTSSRNPQGNLAENSSQPFLAAGGRRQSTLLSRSSSFRTPELSLEAAIEIVPPPEKKEISPRSRAKKFLVSSISTEKTESKKESPSTQQTQQQLEAVNVPLIDVNANEQGSATSLDSLSSFDVKRTIVGVVRTYLL